MTFEIINEKNNYIFSLLALNDDKSDRISGDLVYLLQSKSAKNTNFQGLKILINEPKMAPAVCRRISFTCLTLYEVCKTLRSPLLLLCC